LSFSLLILLSHLAFASFLPLSGVKKAQDDGGCFGGAWQLPEDLLLPRTQVGSIMVLPSLPGIALHS